MLYNLFSNNYEFNGKRIRVNSCLITSKADLVRILRELLSRMDYTFNHADRPTPAWLYNWQQMDYNYLRNCLEQVVSQLCSIPLSVLRDCRLESDGFHFIDYQNCTFNDLGRVCHIKLECDQIKNEYVISIKDLPVYVNDFFERPYTNRKIIIT